jgi:drug/metabolite transporter (DMT)-like permease
LAALYPVITILLAVPLLKEKIGPVEWAGIVCALVGGAALAYETKPEMEAEPLPV